MRFVGVTAVLAALSLASCSRDGRSFTHRYEIESEDPEDRTISANLMFASGHSRETTYLISEDGKSMESTTIVTGIETHSNLTTVDDKTAP
jgi:hypothetical protein